MAAAGAELAQSPRGNTFRVKKEISRWSDAGRAQDRRSEWQNSSYISKPLVGVSETVLESPRLSTRGGGGGGTLRESVRNKNPEVNLASPIQRLSPRRWTPDTTETGNASRIGSTSYKGLRNDVGVAYKNSALPVSPQRGTSGKSTAESKEAWQYSRKFNSSHGHSNIPLRSEGGRYYRGSGVSDDPGLQKRTQSINDRGFRALAHQERTSYGGVRFQSAAAREERTINARGRLKKADAAPADIMDATRQASSFNRNMPRDDRWNPANFSPERAASHTVHVKDWSTTSAESSKIVRSRFQERLQKEEAQKKQRAQRAYEIQRRTSRPYMHRA